MTITLRTKTPKALGCWMPPEWHPHEATWIAWPRNEITWPDRLQSVQETFLHIITLLTQVEKVHLLVDDEETEARLRSEFQRREVPSEQVRYFRIPTVDAWIRDYGPNFLLQSSHELAFNDWEFNAWGEKYEDLKADNRIPAAINEILQLQTFRPGIVLEGGSIDVNGAGLCLTTRQCLLNRNRNPLLSQEELETYLMEFLGLRQVLWLGEGIAGDDTDGHIDDIARFTAADTVVCAVEEDPRSPNFKPLEENLEYLRETAETLDPRLEIVTLPMPEPLLADSEFLPASYLNFYVANGLVLVPTFKQARDELALEVLGRLFPERKVVGIDCCDVVWGMGAIHCLTQQQPRP